MKGALKLGMVLKGLIVFVMVIPTLGHSRSTAGNNNEHAGRKLATSNPAFLSIDCGGNEDHIDEETGLLYKSDTEFVDTGIVFPISPDLSGNVPERLKNVRSFPQGKRNCYILGVEQGIKNSNHMIRAEFKYGNYDGKNQPPVFDLYLGVNQWTTVYTNRTDVVSIYVEIIHVPSTDYIDVCLLETGNGVPFISALELRLLDNSIYQTAVGKALRTIRRYDVGRNATESQIRYPDDLYDRIWDPLLSDDWIQITTDSTIYTESNNTLPALVLRTAAKTQNASIPLRLNWSSLHSYSQFYAYFYFAEIEKLEAGQQRELTIHLSNKSSVANSIKLDYLMPSIIAPNDPPISGAGNSFSIDAAKGSKLPPILNGFEIFGLIELPNLATALDDVEAIMEIKQVYRVTRNWQGDPCVPSEYLWDGLNCSNSNFPSIISLNLSSSKLTGEIATTFSNFKSMQSLDLSYNDLTGTLPEFLAHLPNLKTLNLSGNKLKGSIPEALLQKSMDGKLVLRVKENPDLCLSAQCKKNKKKMPFVIVATAVGVVVVLLIFCIWFICKKRKPREEAVGHSHTPRNPVNVGNQPRRRASKNDLVIKLKKQRYSFDKVKNIIDNPESYIGGGGFGQVYHGTLDGIQVAVKLLTRLSEDGYKAFQAEAETLMTVHHKNLVSLVGYCDENEKKVLIYEYMENHDLGKKLSVRNTNVLSWNERLRIAVDVATGLEYLHNGCTPPIIHRDLKTANIILNEHMEAKIGDFGLSRTFATEDDTHVSTDHAGTFGYMDPLSQTANRESDVYSFGVILLELISGHPAIIGRGEESINVLHWVRQFEGDIQKILDPRLQRGFKANSAQKAMKIALSCTKDANERPNISVVLEKLKECLALAGNGSLKN